MSDVGDDDESRSDSRAVLQARLLAVAQNYSLRWSAENAQQDSDISSLSHLDAPNENVYIISGMFIAFLLAAVVIILVAVTVSKIRKRDDSSLRASPNSFSLPDLHSPAVWQYQSSISVIDGPYHAASEPHGFARSFKKSIRGQWRRLIRKKPRQEVFTLPPELRDQLKQIYVY